jgi:hypothetical protein
LLDLLLLAAFKQQWHPRKHTGAVHNGVDRAEVAHTRRHPGFGRSGIFGVVGLQQHVGVIQGCALQRRRVAHPQAEAMAIGEQPFGDGPADAAAGAADQDRA